MKENKQMYFTGPVLDQKEQDHLKKLNIRYEKLCQPNAIGKLGNAIGNIIPKEVKRIGSDIGNGLTSNEIYIQSMNIVTEGFKKLEEQAANFTISESEILKKYNSNDQNPRIESIDEVCLLRSYSIVKEVNEYRNKDLLLAATEGGATGALGFWGLPFNLVLSTFLYYRAVQSIAMFYGYDVKNDPAELVIVGDVFTQAFSPANTKTGGADSLTGAIGKVFLLSEAAIVRSTAKTTWSNMAAKNSTTLLLTQIRALANAAAKKALTKAGQKGLERNIFANVFSVIGKKLTLKSIGKAIPVVSGFIGAGIDVAQMNRILEFADIFYHKRFLAEKGNRIALLKDGPIVNNSFESADLDDLETI